MSASNIDQELGWVREEMKKIGVEYKFLRSVRGNNWYPHYIHNMDNLFRAGGCFPAIQANADVRRTRLIGLTHVLPEGGCMLVRARDGVHRMTDLKGKKIGLSKSLNTIKNDWWRCQEEQGIELMLMLNGMTRDDVEIVEFPYPDDWYDKPEMLAPMFNPSELWLKRDHKHDLAFRPLETPLLEGTIDAIYTQTGPFQHIQEATGTIKAIENLADYPDWTLQGANIPATFTVSDVYARSTPSSWSPNEGHDQGRALGERAQARRRSDPRQADVLPRRRGHLPGHQCRSTWCRTCRAQNLEATEINKDFMLSHGYIENDFDVHEWAAPEFFERAADGARQGGVAQAQHREAARAGGSLEDSMQLRLG